jgi:predicted nucleic acid-binding protein
VNLVTLDTNALIWGLKRECTPGQEDMLRRADLLLEELAHQESQLVLPTVSLAELMAPLGEPQRTTFSQKARERFLIVPFDARAAHFAPAIWQAREHSGKRTAGSRTCLKADALIIASGYAAGVRCFYSNDKRFRTLAESLEGVTAKDLPTHSQFLPGLTQREPRTPESPGPHD